MLQTDSRASSAAQPSANTYCCSRCASSWSYQAIRNTGRCPACGAGLLRSVDHVPLKITAAGADHLEV